MSSPTPPETSIELAEDYAILAEGSPIGHIEPLGENDEIIGHIEIAPDHRGNGYGRAATRQFLERAATRGVDAVSTSVVISSAYEHVLRDLGFDEIAPEEDGLYFQKTV